MHKLLAGAKPYLPGLTVTILLQKDLFYFNPFEKQMDLRKVTQIFTTSFPGFSPTRRAERERERRWKMLVTWLRNKINSEGGVLCLTLFLSGLFATFTQ